METRLDPAADPANASPGTAQEPASDDAPYPSVRELAGRLTVAVLGLIGRLSGLADRMAEHALAQAAVGAALGPGLGQGVAPYDRPVAAALLARARRWLERLRASLAVDAELLVFAARRVIAQDMAESRLQQGLAAAAQAVREGNPVPDTDWQIDDAREGRGLSERRRARASDEIPSVIPAVETLSVAEILGHVIADLAALSLLTHDPAARGEGAAIALELARLLGVSSVRLLALHAGETRRDEARTIFARRPGEPPEGDPGAAAEDDRPVPKWDGTLNSLHDRPTLSSPEGRAEWDAAMRSGRRRGT